MAAAGVAAVERVDTERYPASFECQDEDENLPLKIGNEHKTSGCLMVSSVTITRKNYESGCTQNPTRPLQSLSPKRVPGKIV